MLNNIKLKGAKLKKTMNVKLILAFGLMFVLFILAISPIIIGLNIDYNFKSEKLKEFEENLKNCLYNKYHSSDKILQAYFDYYNMSIVDDSLLVDSKNERNILIKIKDETTQNTLRGPADSPWSMQSHDAYHTGRSPYNTANNPDGIEKWRFYTDGWIECTPIIDNNGSLYFCGSYNDLSRYIIAINPDGTLKWRYKTEGLLLGSSPALSEEGTIYVGSWDAGLYAINPNGTLKWRFSSGASIFSSPAIAEDGTIYFGNLQGGSGYRIYALNPNGTEKWHYVTGNRIYSHPAIGSDGTVYIGSDDTYLYALYPNGSLRWRFKTGSYVKGPPSVADDGTIYVGSYDGYLYAIYPNGTMRWKCAAGTAANPSIASDGTVYVGGRYLYAIYPNGTMRWVFDLGNRHIDASSPAVCGDGIIYIGTEIGEGEGGEIIAVNPNGTEKWRKRIANDWVESSPSIGEDGTVYIGSSSLDDGISYGYIHAFGGVVSNEPPHTPIIDGPTDGKVGIEYDYFISSVDPDNNPVSFYIDWGDDTTPEWSREYASGEIATLSHTWEEEGTFTIGVKARDTLGEESEWGTLEVTMPMNQPVQFPFISWWLERFPNLFPIIRRVLEQ